MSIDPIPVLADSCWPIDEGCCTEWDTYPVEVQARSRAFAGQALRALTAYRVGGCPITVRPCKSQCMDGFGWVYGQTWYPTIWNGQWINSCGCLGNCACSQLEEIRLPAPVGRIDRVVVDGQVLPGTAYRVDNGNLLVRLDGGLWPTCQNMAADETQPNTMAVTYLNAYPVDGMGAFAAGILACEFAKSCSGQKCRLPSGVTDITRAGISMSVATGLFPGGFTGIREVDAYVKRFNPHHLTTPPMVWSPDLARKAPRVTTTAATSRPIAGPTLAPLNLVQGDDFNAMATVYSTAGGLADLTGYTAQAQIRRDVADEDPTVDAVISCVVHEDTSIIDLHMDGTVTATLTANYRWDLQVESPLGDVSTILYGPVFVVAEVTR